MGSCFSNESRMFYNTYRVCANRNCCKIIDTDSIFPYCSYCRLTNVSKNYH